METLIQQIINGLVLGSIYALSRSATPWSTASSA
jgi:branched-subunit amino acid ABC-type transport system permease component